MTLEYRNLIPVEFSEDSRVWIYQSDRHFSTEEAKKIALLLKNFCNEWHHHGNKLESFAHLFFNRFVIFIVDEKEIEVKGSSMDTAISFLRKLEKDFNVNLLNRLLLSFVNGERIELVPMAYLKKAVEDGIITPDTLYFNNSILTVKDLLTKWIVPVRKSWLLPKIGTFLPSVEPD